jgi:hypothetical protein
MGRYEVRTGFWWRNLREGEYLEDLNVDGYIIKTDLKEIRWGGLWTGLIWIRTNDGALVKAVMIFGLP